MSISEKWLLALLPISVGVIGWLVNHWLSIRSQNKKFHNDIKNDARLKITEAMRDYQEWLMKLDFYFATLETTLNKPKYGLVINWDDEFKRFQETIQQPNNLWDWQLEEYRILFPETAKLRVILQRRDYEISQMIVWFTNQFWVLQNDPNADLYHKFQILNEFNRWRDYITDQSCLLHDLRIYLQNRTLKEITGNHVPERKPTDANCHRVIKGNDGNLDVADGTGNIVNHSKLPFSSHDMWQYPFD